MPTTVHQRFDDNEWFLLSVTPSVIGAAVAGAGKSGIFGTIKEAVANAHSMASAPKTFPNNEIIREIISLDDPKEAREHAKQTRDQLIERIKSKGLKTREQLASQMIEDCREVSQLLDRKASPEEGEQYKRWAISTAEAVAKAAKEGGFLGFGGEQVSANEQQLLAQIEQALGTRLS